MFDLSIEKHQLEAPLPAQAQPFHEPLICKLTYTEQTDFARIVTYFQLADDRNKRNFGMTTFIKHLNLIHHFVVRDDGNDALRGLICGILFGNGFLLVNTDKLKRLTRRSKSCVNGCFQRLGFGVYRSAQDLNGFFAGILPEIGPQWINPRHWCIRKASADAPICFIASLPTDLSAKYGFPVDSYQISNEASSESESVKKDETNTSDSSSSSSSSSLSSSSSSSSKDESLSQPSSSVQSVKPSQPLQTDLPSAHILQQPLQTVQSVPPSNSSFYFDITTLLNRPQKKTENIHRMLPMIHL